MLTIWGPNWFIASLSDVETEKLMRGGIVMRGNAAYALCRECHRCIKVNGFFGDLHVCSGEDDK